MLFNLMTRAGAYLASTRATSPAIDVFVPNENYFADVPTDMLPSDVFPREATSLTPYIGTREERAVIAAFMHACVDAGDIWRGLSLEALIERLHNEADRVENGQLGIRAASVSYFSWRQNDDVKRAKRIKAYHMGIARCLQRGLLHGEEQCGKDVFFATTKLVNLMLRPPADIVEKAAA